MIGWQNPAALWGLLLLAGPVVVHLLRRHRAERVLFPSLRFVQTSQTAAVRVRPPADLLLLLLRSSIVALAVAAVAGPVVQTGSRIARWNAAVARAVVVDTSDSMRLAPEGRPPGDLAGEAAASELQSSAYGRRFDARDLLDGIARAGSWLNAAPPSRREVVVISDFQRGTLDAASATAAMANLNAAIGVRFVSVGRAADAATFEAADLLGSAEVPARSLTVDVTKAATAAVVAERSSESRGVRLVVPPEAGDAAARLMKAVARSGAPSGESAEPVVIRFAGAKESLGALEPIRAGWMLVVVTAIARDATLKSLTTAASGSAVSADLPWVAALRDSGGTPIISAARSQDHLVIDAAASPDTLFAAAVVRAALTARYGTDRYAEREIGRVDAAVLTSLARPAGPVGGDAWKYVDATDARWCWLGVLALLAVEQWLRGADRRRTPREDIRAAA